MGIVTEFVFSCHDFGPNVFVSANVFGPERAWQALALWRATKEDAPDELTWMASFRGAPSLPGFEWIPSVCTTSRNAAAAFATEVPS